MTILKPGAVYFALVFAAGFALGTVRVLFLAQVLKVRTTELVEAPLMLLVSVLAARWTVRRMALPYKASTRLGMGAVALALMLAAEFGLVLWLRGMTVRQYFAARDMVAEIVYYIDLLLFALMPVFVGRR